MLSLTNKPFMLSVILLNVVLLSVIMLNVVAPDKVKIYDTQLQFTVVIYGCCKNNGIFVIFFIKIGHLKFASICPSISSMPLKWFYLDYLEMSLNFRLG